MVKKLLLLFMRLKIENILHFYNDVYLLQIVVHTSYKHNNLE